MNEGFKEKLSEHERKIYDRWCNKENSGVPDDKLRLISPLNDLIDFNAFQYIPYIKLISQETEQKILYIADEVGAGKTIETGIILTELIYHNKIDLVKDTCVIICPNLLCRKWRDTLKKSFGISSVIVHSIKDIRIGLNIFSFDTVSSMDDDQTEIELKLLIVDEAHNASAARFKKVSKIRNWVTKPGFALLLSATPISGKGVDENNQVKLLFDVKDVNDIKNFFEDTDKKVLEKFFENTENPFLCKNRKKDMRYVEEGKDCKVSVDISNHYVENQELIDYKKCCEELFRGSNTLLQFQGINMIMSSPAAGVKYLEKLVNKTEEELLYYLETSNAGIDEDDESEDDEIFELNEKDSGPYTLENAKEIKKRLGDILKDLKEIENGSGSKCDSKLQELIKVIVSNKGSFFDKSNPEHEYYNHIIVFTDKVSTADYLEEKLQTEKLNCECSVIKVTGELCESEKIKRLLRYKEEKNKMSVLIITNVACEGQDLDFGNTIVNYDLDYNPVRLEQRRGRIDRFKINKNKIFIHNFMVKDLDPAIKGVCNEEIDQNADSGAYKYSKVKKIYEKIKEIKNSTGSYYEIFSPDMEKQDCSVDMVKDVNKKVASFAGIQVNESMTMMNLKQAMINDILKKLNKNDIYQMVTDSLIDRGIEITQEKEMLIIRTDKHNQAFFNNIYDGGTLISHLISSWR